MDVFQSWLGSTTKSDDFVVATQSIFQKIESLPEPQRNEIYNQLRRDTKFIQAVGQVQPQTA